MQIPIPIELALGRKYPEPIAIAIAVDARGTPNPITLGWAMSTSHAPPMLAISIGKTRYSYDVLHHADAFVVSFPSREMVEDILYHGTHSGRDEDKLAACGTRTEPARQIEGVLLADAVANFECRKVSEHPTGDHAIFVGEIVAAHMHDNPGTRRVYTLGDGRFGGVAPG